MDFNRDTSAAQDNVRMAGFLEKKGKMKLMSPWKKYWFVLEERLLLYYRSKVEYTNLSPCRGSLNMGLVSTVRPGSSSGPCVIHVITRTQVVQLRAKNRVDQEEWLHALLHSMSLPLVKKTLKPMTLKTPMCASSLEDISSQHQGKRLNVDHEWTLPRLLDYRKKQISGSLYGGSLDTAIWSRKCKALRTPSPNIPKGRVLERILSFSKDGDSMSLVRSKHSQLSLAIENEMKYVGRNWEDDEEHEENWVRCKVHDENQNHDVYSVVDKKKKVKKTLSDTELNNVEVAKDFERRGRKDETAFERIKNALSRIPKHKIIETSLQPKSEKRSRSSNKRRQSFLMKVFKRKEHNNEYESDVNDPLYDTIEHVEEHQPRSLVDVVFREEKLGDTENRTPPTVEEVVYTEVRKVVGSKTILREETMMELKTKLKSRENLEDVEEVDVKESSWKKERASGPRLPPRRVSRPISPWHDVPTNNAPVTSTKSFFVHQGLVKFNDPFNILDMEVPKTELDDGFYLTDSEVDQKVPTFEQKKNDDLSVLLEQLTEITVAPLAEPEVLDDGGTSSSEVETLWTKSQFADPDYDIPRPHKPLNILISQEDNIISATGFMGRCDNHSDTGSSFRSIEPDSLEMEEKKLVG